MILKINYTLKNNTSDVNMGFQLFSEDKQQLDLEQNLYYVNAAGEHEVSFEFDLSQYAEGTYCFRINLFLTDSFKRYAESLDQTNYIYFDVVNSKNKLYGDVIGGIIFDYNRLKNVINY